MKWILLDRLNDSVEHAGLLLNFHCSSTQIRHSETTRTPMFLSMINRMLITNLFSVEGESITNLFWAASPRSGSTQNRGSVLFGEIDFMKASVRFDHTPSLRYVMQEHSGPDPDSDGPFVDATQADH